MSIEPVKDESGLFLCRLDHAQVPLLKSRIARALGYRYSVPDYLIDAIDTVCTDLQRTSRPMCGFRVLNAVCTSEGFSCAGNCFTTGPEIGEQLKQAKRLAVFAGTAGEGYEQLRRDYTNRDEPLLIYALDAVGSELAERIADRIAREVKAVAKTEGMTTSNRYSPGYCGWNVSEQHQLFALLPEAFCGITLTPSAMMYPIKSVSGVIGIGRSIRRNAYRCDLCAMRETCRGRSQRSSQ